MKNKNLTLALLCSILLSFSIQQATAQSWQWGKRAGSNFDESLPGGGNYENTIDMATDYNGNVYSLGRVYGKNTVGPVVKLDVDGHTLSTFGSAEILLTSFNCKGEYRWSKVIGTGGSAGAGDQGIALRTDELGGLYVLGKYVAYNYGSPLEPLHVDADTTLNADNRGIFLVKYDTAGNYQWIRTPEPDTMGFLLGRDRAVYNSQPVEMAINAENEICVLGYFRPGAFEGGAYVVSGTEMTYHMLIYDRFGVFKKGYKMDMACTGKFNNAGYNSMKMSLDKKRNKWYLGGYLTKGFPGFDDTLSMGGSYIKGTGYLGRFDDKGNLEWLKENTWTGALASYVSINSRVVIDEYSNVYIGGSALPSNIFNGYTFANTTGKSSSVHYVMKLDSSGKTIWTKTSDSTTAAAPKSCGGLSKQGNSIGFSSIFVGRLKWDNFRLNWPVGATYIPLFVRINSMTGEVFSADTLATKIDGSSESLGVLQVDRFSNFYLGGGFKSDNDMVVAGNTLVSAGGKSDIFLAKHGRNNCDCIVAPTAGFSVATPAGSLSSTFTFGGTSPSDSVVWYFGDSTESRASTPTHTFKTKGVYNVCVVVYNRCGSDVYCKDVPVGVTSISEAIIANIKIYPNPVNDLLTISELPIGTQVSLTTVLGIKVYETIAQQNNVQISTQGLASGMYIVHISDAEGNLYSTKIVKE